MIHFTDFYLKTGIRERVTWGHDPDSFELQCYAKKHFGGLDKIWKMDSFSQTDPLHALYRFVNGEWVDNVDAIQG